MSSYNFFRNKSILVIENSSVEINKTWCFWETGNSVWKDYIVKSWDTVIFKSKGFKNEKSLQKLKKPIKAKIAVAVQSSSPLSLMCIGICVATRAICQPHTKNPKVK